MAIPVNITVPTFPTTTPHPHATLTDGISQASNRRTVREYVLIF